MLESHQIDGNGFASRQAAKIQNHEDANDVDVMRAFAHCSMMS
jgi:hypothetical protein